MREDEETTKTIKHNMTEDYLQFEPFMSKNYQWPTALNTPAGRMNIGSTNNLESLLLCV